eukprot:EG_transcript_28897
MDVEPPLEEVQLVLRVSDAELAAFLHQQISSDEAIEAYLRFEETPHERRGHLTVAGRGTQPCKLVDLPCVTECYKTLDQSTFYKVGDIGQLLHVGPDAHAMSDKHDSGLTPATQGIRSHWQRQAEEEQVSREALHRLRDEFLKIIAAESDNVTVELLDVPEDASDADILAGKFGGLDPAPPPAKPAPVSPSTTAAPSAKQPIT